MEYFTSGWRQSYYGKGDVVVYRLDRGGQPPSGRMPVFGANVLMLVYGDPFWPTYVSGDNTGLVATDSMKNFIQRETLDFGGTDLESYCRFLGSKFLETYPSAEGVQVSAIEIPYAEVGQGGAFAPSGPERATARIEMDRGRFIEVVSGLRGFKLLRLGGSTFRGFVRDQYTTLPDVTNRPLHMWLDLEWQYVSPDAAFSGDNVVHQARRIVHDIFGTFESGSIQQMLHHIATRLLGDLAGVAEVHLEANNRTWDTIAERGDDLGVYTDPRPPYGCLGLRLRR